MEVVLVDPYVGSEPTVTIQNIGQLELSEIRTMWTVCNSIVGICHSAGTSNGLGPFSVVPTSGNGLAVGDYFTLSVEAVDANGWDRATEERLEITAIQFSQVVEEPEDDSSQLAEEQTGEPGTSALQMVGYAAFVLLFIGMGTFAGLYLSRRLGRNSGDWEEAPPAREELRDFEVATHQEAPEPEHTPSIHPPIPEEGLPPGWTIEQWQYYGEEYLSRK